MTKQARYILIFSTLLLLGTALLYAGGWYMLQKNENEIHTSLAQQSAEALRKREFSNRRELFDESADERQTLQTFVVGKEDVAEFFKLLEDTAREAGLTPKIRTVQEEKFDGPAQFEALALSLEVVGTYAHIEQFLLMTETVPYQMEIRSITLDRTEVAENHSGLSQWRGVIQMRVIKEKEL